MSEPARATAGNDVCLVCGRHIPPHRCCAHSVSEVHWWAKKHASASGPEEGP